MEFEINHVPFEMSVLSAKLFNSKFLSDITFIVEGKKIYAHSLELMKRSTVFQQQLESTLGEKKVIPVTNYRYDIFYQFIRFVYTDQCNISEENCSELFRLAKDYNVIRLINIVFQFCIYQNCVKWLDICVVENHQIALNQAKLKMASQLKCLLLGSDSFLTLHPDTVEVILKFDQIEDGVTELEILDALVRWMHHHCIEHQLTFSDGREKFKNLIRLIRFPTMPNSTLLNITNSYPDLLTKSDLASIGSEKIFGANFKETIWICTPRTKLILPYVLKAFPNYPTEFKTTFAVTCDELVLGGLVFGAAYANFKHVDIAISCYSPDVVAQPPINIKFNYFTTWKATVISLGSSIRVRPNFTYTIQYTFVSIRSHDNNQNQTSYACREPKSGLIINGPPNSVEILESHETMHELWFLKPSGNSVTL